MSNQDLETSAPGEASDNYVYENDDAVDESGEADGDFVLLQKDLSRKKRAAKDCTNSRIQKVVPFPFSPNIRPLTISDLESVVALENAAFHNAECRASPEKVTSSFRARSAVQRDLTEPSSDIVSLPVQRSA